MSMTPENTTPTWRWISDQLTAEQIDTLIRYERESMGRPELLAIARSYADRNVVGAVFGHVAVPAGAVSVQEWGDGLTPDAFRLFWGTERSIEIGNGDGVDVVIRGTQSGDGRVEERGILVHGGSDDPMTAEHARQVAAALLEAADEIDNLAAR
jgi:hypothetical protein